jgi:short-subunit dehydrogenase
MKGTVLITGASGGIGWELAKLFVAADYRVIAVARTEEKLQQLQQQLGDRLDYIVSDLVQHGAVDALIHTVEKRGYTIDYLVNNAGFGQYGLFLETDACEEQDMITLNIAVLTELTKKLLPGMVQRKKGGVLQVASLAAFQPGPLMAVYYASKAYVLSFSSALANELKGTGVTVTALCPGPTGTGFAARANVGESKVFQSGLMDVKTVAKIGFQGFLKSKTIVVPGVKNRLLASLGKVVPRNLVTAIVRKMQETRR